MPKLEVRNVVMEFPAVRALADVSIAFETGEVHGIIGENGAGKSTLMKILGGVQRPTSGKLLLDGRPVSLSSVRDAQRQGIAMIHQELNLVDELNVTENIFLGREITKAGILDRAKMTELTSTYLNQVHATFAPSTRVSEFSIAAKQLVEIAKAVATDASVIIMDEPTAVLSEPEAASLFELIATLKRQGKTVLYISHRLLEVCEICDRITVLRDGAWVTTMPASGALPVLLAGLMVGRPLGDFYPPKVPSPPGPTVLEYRDKHGRGFAIRAGEIVGVAGLVGAGRTELAEAMVGLRPLDGGQIRIGGNPVRVASPKQAKKLGIAYVSEDRKGLGLHVTLSSTANVTLANLRRYGAFALDRNKEGASAQTWKKDLDIRIGNMEEPIANASGGNQQKVAIAKWLETAPKVLILDEPTRGVDVGAKREMYNLIQKLATEGMACLVISSELPEIIGLCDRTLVMREGGIVGELSGSALTEESVMQLAAGVAAA